MDFKNDVPPIFRVYLIFIDYKPDYEISPFSKK